MGEILTMLQLVREFAVDRIVKIDTDTALLSDMWIRQADFVGYHSCNGYYATGCCYSISSKALEAMWQYVLVRNIGDSRYTLPEDQVMTMIAAITGNNVKIIENDLAPYCIPYIGDEIVKHLNRGVQVVHCGQWQRLRGHDDDRLDIIARDMRMLLDSRID